jgi:glycosyltransferase involved in cell wall biosynthesis
VTAARGAEVAGGVIAIIPAFNEQQRIGATIRAARAVATVLAVVVADDGSRDRTAQIAIAAGAEVARHDRRCGKAAAMATGARAAVRAGFGSAPLLFIDADLEESAGNATPLIEPVLTGTADMTIAILPGAGAGGGHGFVMRLAAAGIRQATGWHATAPLSGQRCITRDLFDAVQPLARGFGVETGLTIDALRQGARVVECPVEMGHRVTGTSWRDQRHRATQYRDVWLALAARHVFRVR